MSKWGRYQKVPHVIKARQMDRSFKVESLEGTMTGGPGDWLVMGIKRELYIVQDRIFKELYDWVDDDEGPTGLRLRFEKGYEIYS